MAVSDVARHRGAVLSAAAVLTVVGVGLCQVLAQPEASSWAGAVVIAALCLLLGVGMLPLIGGHESVPLIAVAAGVWGAASVVGGWLQIAQRAGESVFDVGVGDVSAGVETGLPVLVGVLGALAVFGWCVAATRSDPPVLLVAVIAGLGILAVSVTGHGTDSSWAPIVIGVHALCAAWWAGTLGALVATIRGRSGWARMLPEFSRWALPVVVVLTATGIIAAVAQLGVGPQLWESGYGRVLVAKSLLLIVVLGLAWWHRRTWLPRAQRHGAAERESIVRAGSELLVLALVLGLAAGLATTATG